MAVLATPRAKTGIFSIRRKRFFRPGNGVFGLRIDRRHILPVGNQHVTGRAAEQVFGVAADIHVFITVDADAADDQQGRDIFADILNDLFKRFSVQQRRLDIGLFGLGDFAGDVQMGLVNLGQAAVDDFLVQLFLFLKPEDLPASSFRTPEMLWKAA